MLTLPTEEYDVVVFAPFAGVERHARLERRVAESLRRAGANVLFVSCSGELIAHCIVMESMDLDPGTSNTERRAICTKCTHSAKKLDVQVPSSFTSVDVSTLLDEDAVATAARILGAFQKAPTPDFEWEGVPLGAFWSYETILRYKSEERNPQFLAHLEEAARSGSLAFSAGQRLASSSPTMSVLVHSSQYGINRSFVYPFIETGSPVYTFGNSGQISRWEDGFRMEPVGPNGVILEQASAIESVRKAPLATAEIDELKTWFDDRVGQRGAHVYSSARKAQPAAAVRAALRIDARPVVVAFSSSPDEWHAAATAQLLPPGAPPFDPSDQYRFANLFVATARENPAFTFIYRLHPRLAPNKRESRRSPHLDQLLELFSGQNIPTNIVVNSPEQEVGLYELAMIADVGLTWSSTAGLEFLILGIPVIGMLETPASAYPLDLNSNNVLSDVTVLSDAVRAAARSDWSDDTMRAAARWVASTCSRTVVPVWGDSKPSNPSPTSLRKVYSRLPAWLRGILHPHLLRVRRVRAFFLVRADSNKFRVLTNESAGSEAITVDGLTWADLLEKWINWSEVPIDASPQSEDAVLRGLAVHFIARLEPWDGTEGAVRGLRRHAGEATPT